MTVGTKFTAFRDKIGPLAINFASDTFKMALSNTAPTAATDDELADITQISAGNGYTAGGAALTGQSFSAGVFDANDVSFTASGGSIGPFRYAILYDDTVSGDPLICYWDLGSAVTISSGNTMTLTFTTTIYTIS